VLHEWCLEPRQTGRLDQESDLCSNMPACQMLLTTQCWWSAVLEHHVSAFCCDGCWRLLCCQGGECGGCCPGGAADHSAVWGHQGAHAADAGQSSRQEDSSSSPSSSRTACKEGCTDIRSQAASAVTVGSSHTEHESGFPGADRCKQSWPAPAVGVLLVVCSRHNI